MKILLIVVLLSSATAAVRNEQSGSRLHVAGPRTITKTEQEDSSLQYAETKSNKTNDLQAAARRATSNSDVRSNLALIARIGEPEGSRDAEAPSPYLLTIQTLKDKFNKIYNFYLPLPKSLYPNGHLDIDPDAPSLSPECERDVTAIYDSFQGIGGASKDEQTPRALAKLKPWALKMVDSWGKSSDGLLVANVRPVGFIDECLETLGNVTDEDTGSSTTFQGQYCLVTTQLPEQVAGTGLLPLQYGSCIPSSCTEKEFATSLADQMAAIGYDNATVHCQQKDRSPDFNTWEVVGSIVVLVMILPVAAATVLHPFTTKVPPFLKAFAVQGSWARLADVSPLSRRELSAVYGIKVLSISWTIMGHYYNIIPLLTDNPLMIPAITDEWSFQMVWGSTYAAETFFTLSGLLTTLIIMKTNFFMDRDVDFIEHSRESPDLTPKPGFRASKAPMIWRQIQFQGASKTATVFFRTYGVYIARRLLWLVPPILLVVMYCAGPSLFFISGPFRGAYENIYLANCRQNWWVDLTFVSNFLPDNPSCIPSSWYIALDFQLFLVAPLLLLPLKLVPWKYVYTFCLVTVFSLVRGNVSLSRDLIPIDLLDESSDEAEEYERYVRNMPWARAAPYFVGSFCALMLLEADAARQTGTESRVRWLQLLRNKTVAVAGWLVAIATGLVIIFGIVGRNYFHFGPTHSYNYAEVFFYSGFTATAWAVCISWMILMTRVGSGNGGPVGSILSHPIWTLPSRFTYSVYVICYPLELMVYYSMHRLFFVSDLSFIITYTGISVVCFMVGLFVCLFGEAPYVALSKLLLPRLKFL